MTHKLLGGRQVTPPVNFIKYLLVVNFISDKIEVVYTYIIVHVKMFNR
jgi:hypothetical protein